MINVSCEKYDSAHRVIVKKNLTTKQSLFYAEHVIERVRSINDDSLTVMVVTEYCFHVMFRKFVEMLPDRIEWPRK